ncbi:HipA domain-containing protein [Clostridium septicum]|uniref:HipA domain-containing protein n=1 Tax=Clostridium septicum TaxID=1504 RepID=UPI000AF53E86|nr:HipA domain-containing protein [Clostridium septicum]
MMVIDYSQWDIYEGASEGSGRSEKEWLINKDTNEIGLFKFPKTDKTTEHISEKLASELAKTIGLECAKIEIGKYNSRIGSMSYLINTEKEILIEGISLINSKYPTYNPGTMYDYLKDEYYSLEMILNSINDYNLVDDFLKIMIFDFLIGNTDRHQNNWAVISINDNIRMCPLYDNGSSLCCYLEDEKIDSYLGNDKMKFNSLVNTKSKSRVRLDKKNKKETTHLEIVKYICRHYYSSVIELVNTININLTEDIIEKLVFSYDDKLISYKRKQLIKKFLIEKINLLNVVFFGKEE